MKRGAERELNKDNADDMEESEDTPTEGLHKADESILATRVIRGLPKRSTPTAAQPRSVLTDEKGKDAPNFSFGSFNKPYTFTPPTNGSAPLDSTTSANSTSSSPVVSSLASTTAKSFASFLSPPSSSSSPFAPQQPQKASVSTPSAEAANVDDPALYKYYTSLRGLNTSLLEALLKTTKKDPFADISVFLDRYKSLRLDVQKEYDEKSSESKSTNFLKAAVMPTPPAMFTGFGSSTAASSGDTRQSQPKPTSSATTSSLSLPSAPPAAFSFASAPTSAFSFLPTSNTGSSSSGESKPSGGSSSGLSFTFRSSSAVSSEGKTPSQKPFNFAPITDTSKSSSGTTATENSTVTEVPPADKKSTNVSHVTPTANPFSSNSKSLFASSPTSQPNPFGGFTGFGSFPVASGNIGNPVGFGFGSPSRTPDSEAFSGEGTSSPHDENGKDDMVTATDSQESQGAVNHEPPSALSTKNPHDEEGEGEEDEDTVHAVKVKAFVLRRSKEKDAPTWADLGQGIMRLKKHKQSETRRILLRNSNTGKINLNFYIYSGFKPTQNKKTLTFVGHDESKTSQTYSVRLQDEQQASALKETLEREVAAISAKSND